MQLALADLESSTPDRSFAHARRATLDAGAWVEYVPGWLHGPTALFERLRNATAWEARARTMYDRTVEVPRLLGRCEVGEARPVPLVQGERRTLSLPPREPARGGELTQELRALAALLSQRYARPLSRITLAYYRDGRDSVAYHGDRLGALRADTVVAVLSLGARRRFGLRPTPGRASTERPRSFSVGEGDLFVMGGSCQDTWEHGVPKAKLAGPRIAVMFREAGFDDVLEETRGHAL